MTRHNLCTQCRSPLPPDASDREQRYWRDRGHPYPPEPCCSEPCMDAWWSEHGHRVAPIAELTIERLNHELNQIGLALRGAGEMMPS